VPAQRLAKFPTLVGFTEHVFTGGVSSLAKFMYMQEQVPASLRTCWPRTANAPRAMHRRSSPRSTA
jgi:hypothetical protein